jgi:hypothetical protein
MNHNYYYTLLGNKAGGTASTAPCTQGKYLRFDHVDGNFVFSGSVLDQQNAPISLAFSGSVQVWTNVDWANFGNGDRLYLDSALQVPLKSAASGLWFEIEGALFFYDPTNGVENYVAASPTWISTALGVPAAMPCTLSGPYTSTVWVDNTNWQLVTQVWADSARTQPFNGGDQWWSPDPAGPVAEMGTSLLINSCGQVWGAFAC